MTNCRLNGKAVRTGPEPEWMNDVMSITVIGSPITHTLSPLHSVVTMSIIRPFRADDLFRFNNMCVSQPVSFSPPL